MPDHIGRTVTLEAGIFQLVTMDRFGQTGVTLFDRFVCNPNLLNALF